MALRDEMVRFRASNRLTMKQLAEMAGVTYMTISNIERGVQKPSRVTEAKIRLVMERGKE